MATCEWCGAYETAPPLWTPHGAHLGWSGQPPIPRAFWYKDQWWSAKCTLCAAYKAVQDQLRWHQVAEDNSSYQVAEDNSSYHRHKAV